MEMSFLNSDRKKRNRNEFKAGDWEEMSNVEDHQESILLDESVIENCFDVPNIANEKTIKEIKKDIKYVTPNLNEEIVNDIKQGVLNDSANFYRIVEQDSIEQVESLNDKWPCLNLRKVVMKARVHFVRMAYEIITHWLFEAISILVIVANTFTLALEDPTADEEDRSAFLSMTDLIF